MLVLRMVHSKWKETKQQPSMLRGPAVLAAASFLSVSCGTCTPSTLYGDGAAEQISLGEHLFFSLENILGISRTGLSAGRHCAATANSEIGKQEL